jgi:radical SAM superfamily enzyme YgiQ (UPF0313 family)
MVFIPSDSEGFVAESPVGSRSLEKVSRPADLLGESRPKRITLIEPESRGYHWFTGIPLPRLGLPILGAILKSRGHDVEVFCECVSPIDYARADASDLVMISALTNTAPVAYELADRFRSKGIPVVLGGPHPTFMADEALEHADFVLRGECEGTLTEFMEAWETGGSMEDVHGLSYEGEDGKRHNPDAPFLDDLDGIPFPDLTLIRGHETMGMVPVQTSRGCPFDCTFCSVTRMWGRSYRARSVASVIDEIKHVGEKDIFFYDDNLTADRARAKSLLREMLRAGITPKWRAQSRVDVVEDAELLELMRDTNCQILYIGFESINPKTLAAYEKKQTVEDIRNCIERLHKYGIKIHGMFVLGAEDDDVETIVETARFARATGIDAIQFWVLTPFPGTKTREALADTGRIFTDDWSLYDGHHAVFEPKRMTAHELQRGTFKAIRTFYSWRMALGNLLTFRYLRLPYQLYALLFMSRWKTANGGFLRLLSTRDRDAEKVSSGRGDL